MSLPKKLKNLNVYVDGVSYLGVIAEATLPKLGRTMEDWRGGGMDGKIKVDMGGEPIEFEWTSGGLMLEAVRQFGATQHDAAMLRFTGAYQNDQTGGVDAVEIVVRGRHEELDFGNAKPGEGTEHKVKTTCSYYKLTVNGTVEVEIDVLGMVFITGGIDRLAAIRQAILG